MELRTTSDCENFEVLRNQMTSFYTLVKEAFLFKGIVWAMWLTQNHQPQVLKGFIQATNGKLGMWFL